jgi:hypothetical protein
VRSSSGRTTKIIKKVLVVAANREGDPPLALGREIREIGTALRNSLSAEFELYILWAATDSDLRSELLRVKPNILHFCGHGTSAGPILEHTERGNEAVDAEVLLNWLKVALKGITLDIAVLNFCDSHEMLNLLSEVASVVTGPVHRIVDEHAIAFSSAFYMGLAAGGSATFSYHLAESAVEMSPSVAEIAEFASTRDYIMEVTPQSGPYGIRCRIVDEAIFERHRRLSQKGFVFFASEPDGLEPLRLDRKLRKILEVFPKQAPFHLEQRWATRSLDLMYALMNTYPAIVHIAGHGTSAGAFLFEHDRHRNGIAAPGHALARVLRAFHHHIECVLLMFSHSCRVAPELQYVIDCVIAVDGVLSINASTKFSNAFYQMIDDGNSYRDAFDAGIALLPKSRVDHVVFSLQGRNVDKRAADVTLTARRASTRRKTKKVRSDDAR